MKEGDSTNLKIELVLDWHRAHPHAKKVKVMLSSNATGVSKAKLAAGVVSADDDGSLALGTAGVTTDLLTSALYGENGIGSEEFLGDSDVNVFVAKSLSLLEGEAPEVEEKAWNREETTWSLHGASVTCNGQGCTVCNGESCESFVLASEAFRYFLSNLGVAGQATFYELTFLKFRERLVIDVY